MKFKSIQIDCEGLTEKDLHLAFKEKPGFPDFYGPFPDTLQNMARVQRRKKATGTPKKYSKFVSEKNAMVL